ncbi:MAG: sensor histidine kinase [Gemmatimonadales bacterium]
MSQLSFRTRLFFALLTVSVLPLVIVAGIGVWLVKSQPSLNPTAVIDPVGTTDRRLQQTMVGVPMPGPAQAAFKLHNDAVIDLVATTKHVQDAQRRWTVNAAVALAVAAGFLAIVFAAGGGLLLSRQYAAPLDELVDWTRRIQRREPVPRTTKPGTVPELVVLQQSLYELQQGLEQARASELEAERLRAFGEVARRVAHEMKNPLTPIRLALLQLSRRAPPDMQGELDVIASESARLEAMAKDFAELGRLPEGVAAPVDLRELLDDLLRNTVPDGMSRELRVDAGAEAGCTIDGYYDPLRRAFSNLLRNAVEACHGEGAIAVAVSRENGAIHVSVSDTGPGVAPDKREAIFQPYYTEKRQGTGLGLAIVRQIIEQHHGSIAVGDSTGGATFLIELPSVVRPASAG